MLNSMLEVRFVLCDLKMLCYMICPSVRYPTLTDAPAPVRRVSIQPEYLYVMSSKYCSSCAQKRLLSCFLLDDSNPVSKVLATCASCRATKARSSKRKALQPIDPNAPSKRRTGGSPKALTVGTTSVCIAIAIRLVTGLN
jgi:hypothetical protein